MNADISNSAPSWIFNFQFRAFCLVREGQGGERAGGPFSPGDGRGRPGATGVSAAVGVDERRRSLLAAPQTRLVSEVLHLRAI